MLKIVNARVLSASFAFESRDLYVSGERFCGPAPGAAVWDARGLTAVPGLIDVHLHGAVNHDLMDADGGLGAIARYEAAHGVTSLVLATMTMSRPAILRALAGARDFRPGADEAALAGVYLEGPFISPAKAGAQAAGAACPPDQEFFDAACREAGGLIRLIALAPELEGAYGFIRRNRRRVRCAIAHSACGYEEAGRALEAGASQLTHMFNAMPGIHHRAPGPIVAALEDAGCAVELIADLEHVHPAVIRLAFRLFGADRIILISDSMRAAGMGDGEYTLGGRRVTVRGTRAALEDGTLAGSVTNLYQGLRNVTALGVPLPEALKCVTRNPALSAGIYGEAGSLTAGKRADLLLIDADLNLRGVMLRGRWLRKPRTEAPEGAGNRD